MTMAADDLRRAWASAVVFQGEVLWTRCLVCETPLLRPSRKFKAECAGHIGCYWRYYRNHVRASWAAYRGR